MELNVHHEYYMLGREPWEYPDEALVTLCPECHKQEHADTTIPIYNEQHQLVEYCEVCDRCDGYGYIPEYHHVEHGICFKCWGEGVDVGQFY